MNYPNEDIELVRLQELANELLTGKWYVCKDNEYLNEPAQLLHLVVLTATSHSYNPHYSLDIALKFKHRSIMYQCKFDKSLIPQNWDQRYETYLSGIKGGLSAQFVEVPYTATLPLLYS